jgi:hypothetical protein
MFQHLGIDPDEIQISCDRRADLPDFTLYFGPHGYLTLNASQYLVEVEDTERGTICVVPFNGWYQVDLGGPSPDFIQLGTAFLSGLYSVFDYDHDTISRKCLSYALPRCIQLSSISNSVLIILQ